jgi:hypothetical protein
MQERKIVFAVQGGLRHRFLPLILAVVSFIIMLPAIKSELMMDDLMQRTIQLRPEQLPSGVYDTGVVPVDSGKLSTVLFELFGFSRNRQSIKAAKDYGVLPWWVRDDIKAALWRPFTAFTHWLDYKLYPNLPQLMHVHNILWFAGIIFLVTIVYRRLLGPGWTAGLAAVLFLLDKNTYFPVMFVANRGFVVSLFFGLLCLYFHHKWRSTGSFSAGLLSQICLAFSLLSNEAGVSTFAFLLAYALFLEEGPRFGRLLSLLPSVFLIVLWRVIYTALGYGVSGIGGYIDPGLQPVSFLKHLVARALTLLSSQFSGQAPDFLFAANSSLRATALAGYFLFLAFALIIFFPLVRKNKSAQFWFAAMIFTVVPASTVFPLSKNLGFVAVGAFALIALFISALVTNQNWMPKSLFYRISAWGLCIIFLFAHVPGAIAVRVIAPKMIPSMFNTWARLVDVTVSASPGNQDVVIVNGPSQLALSAAPSSRVYQGQVLPKTLRALVPGCVPLQVTRTDDKTLVIKSAPANIFSSDQDSPVHFAHFCRAFNDLFLGDQSFKKGDRFTLRNLMVEVLAVDGRGLPTEVAFHFDVSLNDPNLSWLQFNWRTFSYDQFEVPQIGQTVSILGPGQVTFGDALRYVFGSVFGQ